MSSVNITHKHNKTPEPQRSLQSDFTLKTLRRAHVAKKRASRWRRIHASRSDALAGKETLTMKLIHKPIFAAATIVAVIGIGGTSYAAVNGGLSSITALFGGSQRLRGSRIVKVDLQNCHEVNALNIVSGTGKGDVPRYYRVKDDAPISDQQMVNLAQGICRASYNPAQQAALTKLMNEPQNKDKLVGNAEGKVMAVTDTSVDIQIAGDVTGNRQPFVEHLTNLDPQLLVLDGAGNQRTLKDVHVGDVVYSSYRAISTALTASETTPLDQVDWSKQVLVSIVQRSPYEAVYDQYQKLVADHMVEQVAPCTSDPSGYCTADQL